MRRVKTSRWESYSGNIFPASGNLQERVHGEMYIDGVQLRFSLTRQKNPRDYLYRGSVRIISPTDGKVLRVPVRGSDRQREVKEAIYTNSTNLDEVKEYILDRAEALAAKYAEAIRQAEDLHITPETITPRQAYGRYASRFVSETYKGTKPNEKLNTLKSFYSGLPAEPMEKYSTRAIRDYIRERGFGKTKVRYAEAFWQYCLAHQYCTGNNPFPQTEKQRKSADVLQAEALRADVLTVREQEELFHLLSENESGLDCGVAFMLSGFSTETICDLTWGRITFDESRKDFAVIGLFLEALAGATHDYSRPCIPPCASLLRRRYHELLASYSETALRKMYVIGGAKKRAPSELSRYAAMQLQRVTHTRYSAPVARALLHDTYVRNLVSRCGLDSDPGTFKFLCGYSLNTDTTSANYTSFTSKEAQDRLYTILRVLQTEQAFSPAPAPLASDDGGKTLMIAPDMTSHAAGVIADFVLQPGEGLVISCPHGVIGTAFGIAITNMAESIPNEFQK